MMRAIHVAGLSGLSRPGDGPALILLHGIGSNAGSWIPVMTALDPAVHAIAWNAPGYGDSAPLNTPAPTPADYAARLAAWLDAMAITRATVAGHSLGALFACAFATAYPERTAGLAVFSPALGYKVPEGSALPERVQARIDDLQRLGPAAFAATRAAGLLSRPDAKPDLLAAVTAAMAAVHPAGYAQAVHALGAGDLLADAARIRAPSVAGTGADDTVTPPACAEAAHAALRSATPLLRVPDAGHALPLEAPAPVARLLEGLVRHV